MKIKNMRYEKFFIKDYKTVRPLSDEEELHIVNNNISEVEQCDNSNQCKIIEALFYALVELFEVYNLEMQTTSDANSFFLINKDEGEVKYGVNSIWLSREKLKAASAMELSGVMIDLILHRDKWDKKVSYKKCDLFE